MTCWIIHWAFAEEQMEGQTHMQTCSLADFFTLVHSSIYLDTHVCALKYFWKHPRTLSAFTQQGCLSFCLCCFWHPGCFMSAPPLLLDTTVQSTHYLNRKKWPDTFISPLLAYQYWFHSLLSLLRVLCNTWTLSGPSICRAFLTQLLLFFPQSC